MKLALVWPLVGFLVPTLVLGFGFVIPRSCIVGLNELTVGFVTTLAAACLTYGLGISAARRQQGR